MSVHVGGSCAESGESKVPPKHDFASVNAISIDQFCKRNNVGRTTAYAEIAAGRLVARKCGSRTLIGFSDEQAWLAKLPKIAPSSAQNDIK